MELIESVAKIFKFWCLSRWNVPLSDILWYTRWSNSMWDSSRKHVYPNKGYGDINHDRSSCTYYEFETSNKQNKQDMAVEETPKLCKEGK